MPYATTTTNMAVQINHQVAEKIRNFIGKSIRSRDEILTHIGESCKLKNTPFDSWAKKNLDKRGRGVWGAKTQTDVAKLQSHVRLTEADKQQIAELAVQDALLSTSRVLTDEIASLAGERSGIKPLPVGLKTAIEPYFKDAWARQLSELLLDRPPQIEVVEIDKPLERWKTEELVAELLKRMPQYIPLVSSFYSSIGEEKAKALPPLQRVVSPVTTEKKTIHILVTGLFSRQSSEFLQRTKISHAITNGLRITFIDQDRVRWSFPRSVTKVFMFDKRSHKLWEALCAAYGPSNITEFHGLTNLEEFVLSVTKH